MWQEIVGMRGVSRRVGQLLFVVFAVTLLAGTGPAAADKRVALVIGNSIHERAPLLDEPAADARLLADTLTRLGFTLSGGAAQIDVTKQGFDRALAEFKGRIADADVALIYYAGYGLNLNGAGYLVPVDAAPTRAPELATELRDLNAVLRELEGSSRRQNVGDPRCLPRQPVRGARHRGPHRRAFPTARPPAHIDRLRRPAGHDRAARVRRS
ncbi:caspase family protein [Bradyrhizobium sp. USDA 4353]